MKLEVEMTKEQLNLLILSTEVYARALMNQPDLVADILAEDRFFYDKEDPDRSCRHSCHSVNGKTIWEDTGDYRRSCLGHKQNNNNDLKSNDFHRYNVCDEIPLVYHLFSGRYSPVGTDY